MIILPNFSFKNVTSGLSKPWSMDRWQTSYISSRWSCSYNCFLQWC